MSYAASRDHAQMEFLRKAIKAFVMRWKANPSKTGRRTLFLFPGGEASRLYRATTPFVEGGPGIQHFNFKLNWLTFDSFLGSALDLEMTTAADGHYRDKDNHLVVAYNSISLLCADPYAGFRDWCDGQGIDRFTFGWDWRRPVEDAEAFFLDHFLPEFRATVIAHCGVDPLDDYVLLGHSFGGMVVTNLARNPSLPGNCSHIVTVASPFFGYGGQLHRWFEGDDLFTLLPQHDVIRTISSFAGCYALPFLTANNFASFQTRIDTGDYPLSDYPSLDATNAALDADPFHPQPDRYPTGTGFDTVALAQGAATSFALGQPLDASIEARFTCIRGVVTDDQQAAINGTAGGLTWATLPPPPYDPSQTPLVDGADVPGDGTLPAWTTVLPGASYHNVANPGVEHIFLLDDPETLEYLAGLLAPLAAPEATPYVLRVRRDLDPQPIAPRAALDDLFERLAVVPFDDIGGRRAQARRLIAAMPLGQVNALAGRALADLLKPPRRRAVSERQ